MVSSTEKSSQSPDIREYECTSVEQDEWVTKNQFTGASLTLDDCSFAQDRLSPAVSDRFSQLRTHFFVAYPSPSIRCCTLKDQNKHRNASVRPCIATQFVRHFLIPCQGQYEPGGHQYLESVWDLRGNYNLPRSVNPGRHILRMAKRRCEG
jgi:hypothetical protein